MASIFDLLKLTPPSTPWVRPAAGGRGTYGPASDFLTPDGHLIPRAIGEAALRDSRAILIGDLLVLGAPDSGASRGNW
ncbi:hypothetical protein ACFQ48_17285 [Hymenobacter caeli]|uniref:Uncharacterized protein n=1 Tax=Hymenobacter caeli TaxID=2735894 RepID=A0ABX2FWF0_9BACT|nr:hypothetical protein [Hymenobacter caeli]NRT20754.1 hypothetical protein [Hymenobacter caeli]